jgi:hypothetical protein
VIVNAGLPPAEVAWLAGKVAPWTARRQKDLVQALEGVRDSGALTPG